MSLILNIETSGTACSVTLAKDTELLSLKETNTGKSHASLLSPFIDEVLKEGNVTPQELSAISVSKGPGSYTGLRIGVSTAKGFSYALQIPLIGINTLQSMTNGFLERYPEFSERSDILLCPMIDARRMEVYTCLYSVNLEPYNEISAEIIQEESFHHILSNHEIIFFGDGAEKCKSVINHKNARFIDFTYLSARFMTQLSFIAYNEGRFENTAYFEPFYLKDFIAGKPKNKVLQ